MARRRRPKRRKEESRGTEADKGTNAAQEQCTAPTSGLNDVLAPRVNPFTEILRRFAERVVPEGKREQREDLWVVAQCLETGKYPDFEPPETPDHTRQTFEEYHKCRERRKRYHEDQEAWEDTCEWVTDLLVRSIDRNELDAWKSAPVWQLVETSSFLELLGAIEESE